MPLVLRGCFVAPLFLFVMRILLDCITPLDIAAEDAPIVSLLTCVRTAIMRSTSIGKGSMHLWSATLADPIHATFY